MGTALSLRPLGEALGTEVLGADLGPGLDDATFAAIENIFADHPVLVFRDQQLDATALAALGQRFGRPQPHYLTNYRHPDHPMVSFITNVNAEGGVDKFGVYRASTWHADETYETELPRLAILHALEMPASKGGTMFANMYAAYETLPTAMKEKLAGLTGLHGRTDGPDARNIYEPEHIRAINAGHPERRHPAVKPHPVTGRPVLFVNPTHTHGFEGMDSEEAVRLIEELRDHATQDRFVYYHSWRVGDVVIWDEIATMHKSAGDARPEERRVMIRTIVHPY